MKKVVVKKVGLKKMFITIVPLFALVGLIGGLFIGLMMTPSRFESTLSVDGEIVENTVENILVTDVISGVMGSMFSLCIYGVVIALTICFFILMFNILCKFIGGIELHIDEDN